MVGSRVMSEYVDLTLDGALALIGSDERDDDTPMMERLADRLAGLETEQSFFAEWCRRADDLYYSTTFTDWGADLWADDPSATTAGRSHVSVNTPPVYVDVPASMQAVAPIENMLATEDTEEARTAAVATERVYTAWKAEERFNLKFHKATTTKALYGRTAGYVYWDREKKRPCIDVVQNPRNLYLGYKSDDYEEVEWAAHVKLVDPNALSEEYSVDVSVRALPDDKIVPWVVGSKMADRPRPELNYGPARIEVWDYWYRRPGKPGKLGNPTKMETWNVVIAGNAIVRGPYKYSEYKGRIPYVPLFNTFIPGTPTGRSELWDVEHLIREKMERITSGSQMIAGGTAGDFWQLVGPDAPNKGNIKPKRNDVVYPGAGNRIEAITPFIAQFQLEQYLGRIDRELAVVSGLNELLLGLAPVQSLNSSKAINALVANYESRLSMRRLLLYTWRKDIWEFAFDIWAEKDKSVRQIKQAGGGTLDIVDPSLSPRDDMETATRALNLMNGKVWSQARAMDVSGVDDPEAEQNIIRDERTDALMFPAEVQVMAQLLLALQAGGLQAPQGVQQAGAQAAGGAQNDLRTALGAGTPQATTGSQGEGEQGITPTIPGQPPEAGGAPTPFAQGPAQGPGASPGGLAQTMISGGQAKSRILTQQQIGRR